MIAVARIMGGLYIVCGCFGALLFALSLMNQPSDSPHTDYYYTMIFGCLGAIAVGGLVGAVGEIGGLVRTIANRPVQAPTIAESMAIPPAEWVVVGRDNKGHDRHVRVRAASKEDAFTAATFHGVTQAVSIERA